MHLAGRTKKAFETRLNIAERVRLRALRRCGRLVQIRSLIRAFEGRSVFAIGSGGSLRNLSQVERLGRRNVLALSSAFVMCKKHYGFFPNLWLAHNSESIRFTTATMIRENICRDLTGVFVLIPDNFTESKIHLSSASFRAFRRLTQDTATYVTFRERQFNKAATVDDFVSGRAIPSSFLAKGVEPIELVNGSGVEAGVLPFMCYLGVRRIYFSGIDNLPTGHFWNPAPASKPLTEFCDNALAIAIATAAKARLDRLGVEVFRLEQEMTILRDVYEYREMDEALESSDDIITPMRGTA
jgi:hypothetical protein